MGVGELIFLGIAFGFVLVLSRAMFAAIWKMKTLRAIYNYNMSQLLSRQLNTQISYDILDEVSDFAIASQPWRKIETWYPQELWMKINGDSPQTDSQTKE